VVYKVQGRADGTMSSRMARVKSLWPVVMKGREMH
jgi:hypothetical protein